MEKVCPLCNGLLKVDRKCPACGNVLTDGGMVQNYYGPYSPYVAQNSFEHSGDREHCIHLLYCAGCHYDVRTAWQKVII
ncbi:MAG: hypothetical protein LLG02_07815 [Pelosinus sp.]|nr:hypothetical protein [Pelosinus sp.]